jgi:hypothetical protein
MPDAGGNITKEGLYDFIERHEKIDESIGEAQYTVRALKKQRKELRGLITAAGHTLSVFDETMAKVAMSFEERESLDRKLRRNMAWLGMPLGTQSEMFTEEEVEVPAEIQVSRVRRAGEGAGKAGRERQENPWPAGSLLWATWDEGWRVGKEATAQTTIDAPKRGRGRPKKNAAPVEPVFAQEPEPEPETPIPAPPASGLDFDTDVHGSA